MIPTPGYVYFIKDEFFDLFGPPPTSKLCCNKGPGHMRPYYCCKKDRGSDLFWMVPMTTQFDKYYSRNLDQRSIYGKCITVTLTKYAGKSAAVLIQNAVPVHPEFIVGPYRKKENPIPLHSVVQHIVFGNLQQSLAIHRRGGHVFFPDIGYIKDLQISLEDQNFRIPLDEKITSANARASSQTASPEEKAQALSRS